MKYKKIIWLLVGAILTFTACDTEELHDLNINPQAVNEINMNFLFSNAELSLADGNASGNRYLNWRTNVGYAGYWMQHLATLGNSLNQAGDKYFVNVEADDAPWDYGYSDQLKNLTEVIKQTGPGGFEEGRRLNTRQAARIVRAFVYLRLTDFYGNIPYSEGGQGIEGIFFPTYDTQESIYTALFQELLEAGAAISTANVDDGFAAADMIYQGDITKWKKWANSITLRMAMRISKVNPGLAAEKVNLALSGVGVFSSNDDIPWIPHSDGPSQWVNQNGLSRAFIGGDGGQSRVMSKTLIDVLMGADAASVADDDPRLMIYTDGANGNTDPLAQEGMPNGLDSGTLDVYTGIVGSDPNAIYSRLNSLFFKTDSPYKLMNYSEVEFLQADAKERNIGSVAGTAAEHYNAGVKAAMQMFEPYDASFVISDAAVDTYLAQYPYTSGTAGLEMIGEQVWISELLNWWDAWNYWRQSGYPNLIPVDYPGSITGGQIPTRLVYPSKEVATNNENLQSGGTSPNTHVGKVWWDVD
ncbi:SusD/RagB family nutrient-binding outer membrane lipoprotein [Aurantibacter crassamenti]|uniref:SusD/RagB family nutrient-binding outer membrane lipoprotein n=1 Tax=Aurantibacter crassamenti TaxID=1837375 RepID=UPI0019399D39|nr:SusD/RagB family nutrient-binding outer membrane lipoprotein [Aurantibacter crassamenti]MBM1105209.1 SusD/RagB family nutrient-binding outer membrane lipoprotein [Aurantibacter crassamenti]